MPPADGKLPINFACPNLPKSLFEDFYTINIHPSLLPKFGGRGMYGKNVHKSVVDAEETRSAPIKVAEQGHLSSLLSN